MDRGAALPPLEQDDRVEELHRVVGRVVRARVGDRHQADDLVQETLTRVLARRSELEPDALRPYAIVTAQNLVASTRRTESNRARNTHRLVDMRTSDQPEDVVLQRDERRSMKRAMAQLSARDREVLVSHEVLDITTRELAEGDGTTPGAIAVRLAGARAKLRLEYVLSHRREEPLSARCRSVLVALSAGDTRRKLALDAEGHVATCERCAQLSEPLMERSRAAVAILPLIALRVVLERAGSVVRRHPVTTAAASVTVAGVLVVSRVVGGTTPAPTAAPDPAPRVAPAASAPAPAAISIEGSDPSTLSPDALRALAGRPVTVRSAVVSAVPADEGFWLEDDAGGRFWVELTTGGESPIAVEPGERVSFTGTLVETAEGEPGRAGLDPAEGAAELLDRGVHIEVPADEVLPG